MNQTTDQELKEAFLNKAVEHLLSPAAYANQSDAAQVARDDLKDYLSSMIIFHHVGKK